jgi:hypothetical protein
MIVEHFLKECAAPRKNEQERAMLAERIAALTTEIDPGAVLVFSGTAPAAIVDGLRQREAERRDLQAKLEHLDGLSLADLPDLPRSTMD